MMRWILIVICACQVACQADASLGRHASDPADGGTDAAMCVAPDGSNACHLCQVERCCSEYAACAAADPCLCLVDCGLVSGMDCTTHCGGTDGGEHSHLGECITAQCAAVCP